MQDRTYILALDIGTTQCKAACIDLHGSRFEPIYRPTPVCRDAQHAAYFDPDELWQTCLSLIRDAVSAVPSEQIAAVAIGSMAETGLLLDR